jgi:hypothetical protein
VLVVTHGPTAGAAGDQPEAAAVGRRRAAGGGHDGGQGRRAAGADRRAGAYTRLHVLDQVSTFCGISWVLGDLARGETLPRV